MSVDPSHQRPGAQFCPAESSRLAVNGAAVQAQMHVVHSELTCASPHPQISRIFSRSRRPPETLRRERRPAGGASTGCNTHQKTEAGQKGRSRNSLGSTFEAPPSGTIADPAPYLPGGQVIGFQHSDTLF
ncbi:uncharacterized protein PSANT_05640 [Moesziomyces antarcticus]|uniref:Uncharacterized protein n=1 Tax=Pseudozyma antarctica TaxID=84753 RepID=A0A5C3FUH3_PSEA2|nr:uncharacterized protein PSANT_05640 [Moesziomyces antarcticus]